MVRKVKIGKDIFTNKDIIKLHYEQDELPKPQLFDSKDVIFGNPSSNIAIAFIYTWKSDKAPDYVQDFFVRLSNYASIVGYWRTTNGARYVFSNILANPNINKLICMVFGARDNGHLVVDALRNFYLNGIDSKGIIKGSNSPNPKFEQVPKGALDRFKKQVDLIILKNVDDEITEEAEEIIKACYQESENAVDCSHFPDDFFEMYKPSGPTNMIYDDGARFHDIYKMNLSGQKIKQNWNDTEYDLQIGQSIQAEDLDEAINHISNHIFHKGLMHTDQRGITTFESRSITLTIMDPLKKIPIGFSKEYIHKYVAEFIDGEGIDLEDFKYTYHNRIFKHWGDQTKKVIEILKEHPETRRAIISLWDPSIDLKANNPPCLNMIGCFVRDGALEFHVIYRSHHLSTITLNGNIMKGEGALVPNLYAIATLQQIMADEIGLKRGALVLTDFSGHLYANNLD